MHKLSPFHVGMCISQITEITVWITNEVNLKQIKALTLCADDSSRSECSLHLLVVGLLKQTLSRTCSQEQRLQQLTVAIQKNLKHAGLSCHYAGCMYMYV